MSKMITRESIEATKEKLTRMEKPQKMKFNRKDAIREMSGVIKSLLSDGWDFEDIASSMRDASDKGMNYRASELKEMFEDIEAGLICTGKKHKRTSKAQALPTAEESAEVPQGESQ